MADACEAVRNAKAKFRVVGTFQEVSFRSKRDTVQRFGFDRCSLKESFVFSGNSHRIHFHSTESFSTEMEGTSVVYEDGRWFLVIPGKRPVLVPETQRNGIVALDPGVRTFLTYYSEALHGKIGEGDFKNIYRLCKSLDDLQSKISNAKCKVKRRMKKAAGRIRWKIYNLIEDLHKKSAHWLVKTFDVIMLPLFKTSGMVSKLRSKTARSMLTFAHFRFKSFLKAKAEEYSCLVLEPSEAWTSRTCSYCGKIQNIGSKKVMKCDCGAVVCRDHNAARGYFLRSLGATPSLSASLGCIC